VAAFTRALLLDDAEALRRLSPELRAAWPALGADLDALSAAAAGDERRFVIARFLLRYPGLRPFMTGGERRSTIDWAKAPPASTQDDLGELDGLRDNWWCALSLSPTTAGAVTTYEGYQPGIYARSGPRIDAMTASLYAHPERVPWPDFLTVNEKARAQREWQALEAIAGAPDYLGRGGPLLGGVAPDRPTARRGAASHRPRDTSGLHDRRQCRRLSRSVHRAPHAFFRQRVGEEDAVLVPLACRRARPDPG
jgi:hypothetical protein